ncbi:DUF1552 domain-containing protein [Salinibius halmophilus]|uniref:DUF1552 domain-containing protein n=1 Tax=Salinibius halmophilus TaxID=1853216 RepID=UPI000E65F033|nr:DUF1552 domain-containing protein [Salinibius halmophilus]
MKPVLSRRRFLQAAAASAAILPLPIQALANTSAASGSQKKVVFIYVPDGVVPNEWHAQGSGYNFNFAPMSQPLEAIRQHVVMLKGIHMYTGSGHVAGMEGVLTGGLNHNPNGNSLDLVIADAIGQQSAFRSLSLGVGANYKNNQSKYATYRNGLPQSPIDSPVKAYEAMFGKQTGGDVKQLRLNAVDAHKAQVDTLRSMLGMEDRAVLDAHMEALRQLETQLNASTGDFSALPVSTWEANWQRPANAWPPAEQYEPNFADVTRQQMDVMVAGLQSGRTKVGHIQISHPVCEIPLSQSPDSELAGLDSAWHSYSHHGKTATGSNYINYVKGRQWFTQQVTYFVQKLEQTGLLDDTLVVCYSELGDGMDHDAKDMPFFLAGGRNVLTGGRALSFNGETHTKLLTSIANLMDVPMQSFGYTGAGTGDLPGLIN